MIKVMVIDSKQLLLESLAKRLSRFKDVDVIGKFTDPQEALEAADIHKPDIIMLDIELGEINGIELVEIFQSKLPHIGVVFITSSPNYAVQAFELNAIDYLVRPFCDERFIHTMNRTREHYNIFKVEETHSSEESEQSSENEPEQLSKNRVFSQKQKQQVCLFNELKFIDENATPLNTHWRTKKAKELFAILLHYQGESVSKELIVNELWPCYEWDNGMSLLYNAIYHLRRAIERIGFNIEVQNTNNHYTLHLHDTDVDVYKWQREIDELPTLKEDTYDRHKDVIYLYKGDYLKAHSFHWTEGERNQLRSIWLYHVRQVTNFLVKHEEFFEAIQLQRYVQETSPAVEESYFTLMKLYNNIEEKELVQLQYNLLKEVLKNEYEVEPNQKIKRWYESWKMKHII